MTHTLKGQRFGRLIASDQLKRINNRSTRQCTCDCGTTTWVSTSDLLNGHTKSCGCLRIDINRINPGQAAFNEVFDSYKRNAEKRKLSFKLTLDQFIKLTQSNCYYCHRPPSTIRKGRRGNGNFIYNGIDRLNSKLGYTQFNCRSCCPLCNRAKSNLSEKEFLAWVQDLINAQQSSQVFEDKMLVI